MKGDSDKLKYFLVSSESVAFELVKQVAVYRFTLHL